MLTPVHFLSMGIGMKNLPSSLLDEITRRLVAEFQPERGILFGSHAWGDPTDDSDVDLMVIVPGSDEKPVRRAIRARRSLLAVDVPMDILVKTHQEFECYRHVKASLEHLVAERGKVLYG